MGNQVLQESLDELIRQQAISTVLQPIVDLRHHRALGYEALTRTAADQLIQRPDQLFQLASQFNRITELEWLCLSSAVRHYAQQQKQERLFLNLCPQSVFEFVQDIQRLIDGLATHGLAPSDIVIEISERFPIDQIDSFLQHVSTLKSHGFRIAIDDLGSGYSGLKLWSQIHPDYVKIDRHFIHNIHHDSVKQAFVSSVVHLCDQLQCEVIAEGIESAAELQLIQDLGIHIGQGYLLGKPQSSAQFIIPAKHHGKPTAVPSAHGVDRAIHELAHTIPTIRGSWPMRDVDQYFRQHPDLMCVPVLDEQRPIGLLHRQKLLEVFSLPYGRALFERRTAKQFMHANPIVVEHTMTLEAVSHILTNDEQHDLQQHLIVTNQGEYHGVVSSKDILRHITASQLQKARYANPLTLLPGNVPIDEHIARLLQQQTDFYLLYLDLNHFKPYNDHYGYRQGDTVLRWLGRMLQEHGSESVFVGHIGGDDFVMISQELTIHERCQQVLAAFDQAAQTFHQHEDWQRGYHIASDRSGRVGRIPLLSLSIGVVPSYCLHQQDIHSLAQLAAIAKKAAKNQPGSAWYCLDHDKLAHTQSA